MKLTVKEQEICDQYGARDDDGYVHCADCPLCISNNFWQGLECYATIDGRTSEARKLKRW